MAQNRRDRQVSAPSHLAISLIFRVITSKPASLICWWVLGYPAGMITVSSMVRVLAAYCSFLGMMRTSKSDRAGWFV